ncbi:MAG: PilZ domain-containing protein [Nitrospiraceae bacterium]|nr:MAG: PilZ domain-containing protein [Nitrospiraceae bacterium]
MRHDTLKLTGRPCHDPDRRMDMKERRASERIAARLDITFYCCDKLQQGTVTNISDRGMFISTQQMCFPFDSHLDILIPSSSGALQVKAHLRRIEMFPDSDDGMGVEIVSPSGDYLSLVEGLRSVR